MNKNIKYFFALLNSYINNTDDCKLPILIFKTRKNKYSCIFLMDGIVSDYTLSQLNKPYEKVAKNYKGEITLRNISQDELNYILYIFNMKFNVLTSPFENFDNKKIISFYSNGTIFRNLSIHLSKNIMDQELLKQHFIGTQQNSFKYDKWIVDYGIRKKFLENTKKDYREYAKILNYYMSTSNNPIEDSYLNGYEIVDNSCIKQEQKQEIIIPANKTKEKKLVYA